MASKRAQGRGVPQPEEPKGPATVELREYLKGSGMGLPPDISRTATLKNYCIYSVWFPKVEPSPIGGFEGERVFRSVATRRFLLGQLRNGGGGDPPLEERMLSAGWVSGLESHRDGVSTSCAFERDLI